MFERCAIPTPFQVGPVNCYLAGRTLVDPGPAGEDAWAALREFLAENDLDPEAIERVLVTHPHPDHFGLARRLQDHGAEVLATPAAADIIADFEGRLHEEQAYFVPFFVRHGMSEETARTVTGLPEAYVEYAPSVEPDAQLADGDELEVAGRSLAVEHVAGHAPGEAIFRYETRGGASHAVVGDHVLADITPNPLLQPPESDDGDRPRVLPAYNRSLARLRDADYDGLLPGHRETVEDPAGRIAEILAAHEERTDNVRALVDGPTTAMEVMEGLFGDLPVTEYFPGMSEAIGHLDVLEARDLVVATETDGTVVYEPV